MTTRRPLIAVVLAATVVLLALAATPAFAARDATPAERRAVMTGVKRYGCAYTVTRVRVASSTPAWARVDMRADPDSAACDEPSTYLMLRLPGHRFYDLVWAGAGPRPCWMTGQAVLRDLIPEFSRLGCERPARVGEAVQIVPSAMPGRLRGVRMPTARERAGISRQLFGPRRKCWPTLYIRVARGNQSWALGTERGGVVPRGCEANGVVLLVKLPGSGRWVVTWAGSGFRGAPCWVAGRGVILSLMPVGSCERRGRGEVLYISGVSGYG